MAKATSHVGQNKGAPMVARHSAPQATHRGGKSRSVTAAVAVRSQPWFAELVVVFTLARRAFVLTLVSYRFYRTASRLESLPAKAS